MIYSTYDKIFLKLYLTPKILYIPHSQMLSPIFGYIPYKFFDLNVLDFSTPTIIIPYLFKYIPSLKYRPGVARPLYHYVTLVALFNAAKCCKPRSCSMSVPTNNYNIYTTVVNGLGAV